MDALKKEPALIIGAIAAGAIALIGGLNDGFTWNPDGWDTLAAILAALGIRQVVFSPSSVEKLKTRPVKEGTTLAPK